MADQQFLASFGVDIDESGVSRLQKILAENRTLAESLSTAFNAASESVKVFREQVTTDLPTLFSGFRYGNVTENLFGEYAGLKIGLNMTEPKKEMASFTADAKKPIPLAANASGIVSAARTALENVRSLFSETFTLNIRAETNNENRGAFRSPPEPPSAESFSAKTSERGDGSAVPRSRNGQNRPRRSEDDSRNPEETASAFQRMSTGGRFTRPTDVQVAEDGDAEYIIPVKKESRALPLLRQLLSELSPEARQNLTGDNKESSLQTESEGGEGGDRKAPHFPGILNDSEETSDKKLPPVRETLAAETIQSAPSFIWNDKEELSVKLSSAASQTLSEADRPLSAAAVQLPAKPELLPASDAPLPPVRETLTKEISPTVSVPLSAPDDNSPNLVNELLSELKSLAKPEQQPLAVPQSTIKEDAPALPASTPPPLPLPSEKKENPALSALIPDLRKTFAETDRPLAPVTAGTVLQSRIRGTDKTVPPFPAPVSAGRKELLPADSALPKQNLSDLVSQLSSVLRPSGGTVNNTSNNLSAPVTINVNANGSDANRIGESIYDTAERYLLRTMKGAFA